MWGAEAASAPGAARRGTVHRRLASNRGAKLWTSAAHHNRTRGIATTLCEHKCDRYQLALLALQCCSGSTCTGTNDNDGP